MTITLSQAVFWSVTFLIFLGLIWLLKGILLPFVLGALIAYLLNPVVGRLEKLGLARRASVLLILGSFFAVLTLLLAIILPILVREGMEFLDAAPKYGAYLWEKVQPLIAAIQEKMGYQITDQLQVILQDNMGKTLQVGKGLLAGLAGGGEAVVGFMTTLFLTPIAAYFMMKEWPAIVREMGDMMPRHHETTLRELIRQIDEKISGFVRGQIMICGALGLLYAIALSIAGLNYGFVIGLGTGILSIIPYVGSTLGLATSLVVSYLQSGGDWSFVGIIAVIFFVGQFIEGNFITPKLMGDSVGLHPLWIIFALMAGGSLLGLLGMFLAIPIAAIIGVLLAFAFSQYKASSFYRKKEDKKLDQEKKNKK
jgi:predicted PurR-regulated permease PerM